MRLFVAVPVPPDALEACRRLLDAVRASPEGRRARWVRTENLHLTLRFLGPTPGDRVPEIVDALQGVRRTVPFAVELEGAGGFPAIRRPRALWIGIAAGAEALEGLEREIEAALAPLGWPAEARPFRPHLTVARTDAAGNAAAAAAQALERAAAGWRTSFLATEVVLYRSHLGGGPPRYEPLEVVELGG